MTAFKRIKCAKPQASDDANRILVEWQGVSYAVNQRTLNRFANGRAQGSAGQVFGVFHSRPLVSQEPGWFVGHCDRNYSPGRVAGG
jgi:hypothetical protein